MRSHMTQMGTSNQCVSMTAACNAFTLLLLVCALDTRSMAHHKPVRETATRFASDLLAYWGFYFACCHRQPGSDLQTSPGLSISHIHSDRSLAASSSSFYPFSSSSYPLYPHPRPRPLLVTHCVSCIFPFIHLWSLVHTCVLCSRSFAGSLPIHSSSPTTFFTPLLNA
jgi:hypothetical protein